MATVFMKWLETRPQDYERGIHILTLGRLRRIREAILCDFVKAGMRILEIGCGTGVLTARMAARGAHVTAIDISPAMLAEAERTIIASGVSERVALRHMDATSIAERLPASSFDLIVAVLVFSELSPGERRHVLEACARLLAPGGRLLIADEVVPKRALWRLAYVLIHGPLRVVTWLLTRATTRPLHGLETSLPEGLHARAVRTYLGGSLVLYELTPATAGEESRPSPHVIGRLRHKVTPRSLLIDLWALFFRIIPPYPKVRPGLYLIGHPGPDDPVLVTGNFDLTVRRVVRAVDGKVDAWLLVADSAGVNVWCGAGGGYFTTDKIIAAVRSSHLDEVVHHRTLILPQLCANGVDGWRLRRELGWEVLWGPVRAADIPEYLRAGCEKTTAMRLVRFPLKDRLEMTTVTLGFYGLILLLPVMLFWRHLFWPLVWSLAGLSYFYAVVHPWLPGRDGLMKSIPLAAIALLGMLLYSTLWDPASMPTLFRRGVGMAALSVFTGAELQGMSPLMRGEQANWGWEAIIGIALAAIYWGVPMIMGWK